MDSLPRDLHCAGRTPLFTSPCGVPRTCRSVLLAVALAALGSTHAANASNAAAHRYDEKWIGTWAASPQSFMPGELAMYQDQTLRLIVHTSVGGTTVRIKISNTFGDHPLLIGGAHIARRAAGADIDPTSDRVLRFGGRSLISVPEGSTVMSDSVGLDVPPRSDLAVSLFLPQSTVATTAHSLALQTSYGSPGTGDSTAAVKFPVAKTIHGWPFLTGVDVTASSGDFAIVAFGDSGIDGDGSTPDANRRWPDVLAARLQSGSGRKVGVLNQGIIGNRLLRGSPPEASKQFGAAFGEAGVARFERDVLAQAGVRYVIVRLGVNDLGFPGAITPAAQGVTAEDLISGYRQLIAHARKQGVIIIGTTLAPFEGTTLEAGYYTSEKEAVRQRVNAWIRGSGEFDAVVDFDGVLRDASHPARLLPVYDSGDHLHPNDAGYAAMAKAVPLALFDDKMQLWRR
jgi:lysophospholipase L1-like esterase